jgi:hypothetical protein
MLAWMRRKNSLGCALQEDCMRSENTVLSPDILIVFIVANDCDLTVGRKIVRNGRLMF